ncbi:hypothetical protein PLICRDRAFT_173273 [Plicaturopsis crispa FD-325 SS-3]|nr:hypothetical protein PLICRDRAFT_173273 [Plicaturopsis crispa FD-325 SS-3]
MSSSIPALNTFQGDILHARHASRTSHPVRHIRDRLVPAHSTFRHIRRPTDSKYAGVDSAFTLPSSVLLATESVIKESWAPDTQAGYSSGVAAFCSFCDEHGVPLESRLPAFGNSSNCVSGVRAWHITNNVPWEMGIRLRQTLRGVHALAPKGRPPRPPVTSAMLEVLARELDLAVPMDACVLAAATSALWGQARLGELFSPWANSFDGGYIPMRSSLSEPTTEDGSRPLHLPWSKTRKSNGDIIMICRQNGASDPIDALENHLLVNNPPPNIPLFSFKSKSGFTCLTKKRLLLVCNRIWAAHGFVRFQGHGFRIGGTTELLLRGVDPEIVKSMGRWTSDAFLRYWRELETLIPMHVERLATVKEFFSRLRADVRSSRRHTARSE